METTIKMVCNSGKCKSEYQDSKYGKNVRVHNLMKQDSVRKSEASSATQSARCTVCGSTRNTSR